MFNMRGTNRNFGSPEMLSAARARYQAGFPERTFCDNLPARALRMLAALAPATW